MWTVFKMFLYEAHHSRRLQERAGGIVIDFTSYDAHKLAVELFVNDGCYMVRKDMELILYTVTKSTFVNQWRLVAKKVGDKQK